MSRYASLAITLNQFASPAAIEPPSFGEAMDKLDQNAYTFTATLTVLPFLQPIPLGFFALIGSAAFIALGLQLYKGEPTLKLPHKIRAVTLNLRMRQALVKTCLSIIGFCRKFSKPRLSFLITGALGQKIGGAIFIAVGLLVAIPLGGIVPFKNLFPSLAILFYCTGEIEQDGLMIIFSILCVLLTVIFYSVLFYIVWKFGSEAIQHFLWA